MVSTLVESLRWTDHFYRTLDIFLIFFSFFYFFVIFFLSGKLAVDWPFLSHPWHFFNIFFIFLFFCHFFPKWKACGGLTIFIAPLTPAGKCSLKTAANPPTSSFSKEMKMLEGWFIFKKERKPFWKEIKHKKYKRLKGHLLGIVQIWFY